MKTTTTGFEIPPPPPTGPFSETKRIESYEIRATSGSLRGEKDIVERF